MKYASMTCRWTQSCNPFWIAVAIITAGGAVSPITLSAQGVSGQTDPRVGLGSGWHDAEEAISNLQMVGHRDRPPGFVVPDDPGFQPLKNSDLAFKGDLVFMGNYNGFNVYNVADPGNPELVTSVVCPGAQGDISIYGDLLFRSDQETRARLDCGVATEEEIESEVDPERFRGVRIFDISDVGNPVQVAAVQTCRGSHTHNVVSDPSDPDNVYNLCFGDERRAVR